MEPQHEAWPCEEKIINCVQQIYLTYINTTQCDSYTLTGTVNDNFIDLDASERFVHIPLMANEEGYNNTINLQVNYTSQHDLFKCIPAMLWQAPKSSIARNRYDLFQPPTRYFLPKHSMTWLGSQSKIEGQIKLKKPDATCMYVNDTNKLTRTRITMNNFCYIPQSWFVCYKNGHSNEGDTYNYYASVRVSKNLQFSQITSNTTFNYISIGNKTIAMHRVLYYARINSIWDYLRCFKTCEHLLSVQYNY